MAEGTSTYRGLAVPLQGESEIKALTAATDILTITGASSHTGDYLVLQQNDGTEMIYVGPKGSVHLVTTHTASTDATQSIGGYSASADQPHCGFGVEMTSAQATSGWGVNAGGAISLVYNGTQEAAQNYGGIVNLTLGNTASNVGGRNAVLDLMYYQYSGFGGEGEANTSFINFHTIDQQCPALFTILTATTDAGMFVTTDQSASRGLKCIIDNVVYYILLGATS